VEKRLLKVHAVLIAPGCRLFVNSFADPAPQFEYCGGLYSRENVSVSVSCVLPFPGRLCPWVAPSASKLEKFEVLECLASDPALGHAMDAEVKIANVANSPEIRRASEIDFARQCSSRFVAVGAKIHECS